MAKLVSSRHDRWHVHKTLGVAALVHFAYRAFALLAFGRGLGGLNLKLLLFLSSHVALNASSFLFDLPKRRNSQSPMIWPAFRAHNLVFALRNVLGVVAASFLAASVMRRIVFVCGFMALADAATLYFREDKTTRAMPYFDADARRVRMLKSFYMQCQFHATILSVTDPTLSFMSVLPIQLASFGMTLARKSKISSRQWHALYALALASLYLFVPCRPISATVLVAGALGGLAKELRHHLALNKYLLWALTLLAHDFILRRHALSSDEGFFAAPAAQRLARLAMRLAALRVFSRLAYVFYGGTPPAAGGDKVDSSSPLVCGNKDALLTDGDHHDHNPVAG